MQIIHLKAIDAIMRSLATPSSASEECSTWNNLRIQPILVAKKMEQTEVCSMEKWEPEA